MASSPIISRQIDGEIMETVRDFIFLGSKITADGDWSHEIKRCLLLGRKAMTRHITLLTKVHLVKVKSESHSVVSDSLQPHELYSPWNSPDKNTGVSGHSLQRIFPMQESNWGFLHCRQILYQLSYQGSPHLVKAMVFPIVMYDVRVGLWRELSAKELMLLNCGVGGDSWESFGLLGDPTSQS